MCLRPIFRGPLGLSQSETSEPAIDAADRGLAGRPHCPQFHTGPIGVCVQHGPMLPPL